MMYIVIIICATVTLCTMIITETIRGITQRKINLGELNALIQAAKENIDIDDIIKIEKEK